MTAMKKNNYKSIIFGVVIALVLGGLYYLGTVCKVDGSNVCFSNTDETFKLEENVNLRIAVETEETKEKLIEIWTEMYPESSIEIDVVEPFTRVELSEPIDYDLYYVEGSEAMYFMGQFKNLGQKAQSIITENIPINLQDSFNINGLKFVPQNVNGQKLYLNLTLLEELGLSREDVSSFEKIKENEELILSLIDVSFPFSLKDETVLYPFLTGGGWTLNFTHDGMNPNFDSEEFLKSMEFIEFLKSMNLINGEEDLEAMDLPYNFEDKFFQRKSLFGLISDTELAKQYQEFLQDDWLEVPFPTFEGNHLAQHVDVRGYVVNEATKYPSASTEVLRILRSIDFIELGSSFDYPILSLEFLEGLDSNLIDRINAFGYGDVTTILALEVNPTVKSSDILDDIDYLSVIADLYDGKITAEEAQIKFIDMANEWLLINTPEVEDAE